MVRNFVVWAELGRECLLSIPPDICIHCYTSERVERRGRPQGRFKRFCTGKAVGCRWS